MPSSRSRLRRRSSCPGSVLLAILAHNAINWALSVWEKATGQKVTSLWPAVLGLAVLAVIAVAVTRGRLGYRSAQ